MWGFWVQDSGLRGSGFRVQGSGVLGSRFRGSGFRVRGSGFRVRGSGFWVQRSGFRGSRFCSFINKRIFWRTEVRIISISIFSFPNSAFPIPNSRPFHLSLPSIQYPASSNQHPECYSRTFRRETINSPIFSADRPNSSSISTSSR
jgi:hypothetical protein